MNSEPSKADESKLEFPEVGLLFPELPPDVVVVIDSEAVWKQRMVGQIVAKELGAVLLDTNEYYGCLLLSCMEARIDLSDPAEVWKFYARARVDVSVKHGTADCDEASILVNGDCFWTDELEFVREDALVPALLSVTADIVRLALKHTPLNRRMVVLGRDLGKGVLKATPFKFLLKSKRDASSRRQTQRPPADSCSHYAVPRRSRSAKTAAVEINVGARPIAKASDEILTQIVLRNSSHEDQTKVSDRSACRNLR